MASQCPFCRLVTDPEEPTRICEFEHSVAFVDFEQADYPGSSILVLKGHYDHVHEMPAPLLHAFMDERTKLAKAVIKVFPETTRLNYASLGNGISHVHEYIISRHINDRNSGRSPWPFPNSERLSDENYRAIATKIRAAIDH